MTDEPSRNRSRSIRHWLRFSLRTLFLFVTVIGLWLGYEVNNAQKRREAISTILELQGRFSLANLVDFSAAAPVVQPPKPHFLQRAIGDEYFDVVKTVELSHATDSDLEKVANLSSIQSLILLRGQFSDVGLAQLGKLKKLQRLRIQLNYPLTDASLEHLKDLTKLRHLSFSSSSMTFDDIKSLELLKKLESLESLGFSGRSGINTGRK